MSATPRRSLLGFTLMASLCSLVACADRATDLNCSVVSMRNEPGTSPGHGNPESAAAAAVAAADYVADTSDGKSMRAVYAYNADDDLLAIITVENVPENDGWVALGVDRCAT